MCPFGKSHVDFLLFLKRCQKMYDDVIFQKRKFVCEGWGGFLGCQGNGIWQDFFCCKFSSFLGFIPPINLILSLSLTFPPLSCSPSALARPCPPPYAPLGAAQFVPEDNFEVLRMGGLLSLVKSDSNVNISFVDFESKCLYPSFSHG